MTALYFNPACSDDERREQLYRGDMFIYAASDSTRALCAFAREQSEAAFAPHDPRDAQHHLSQEEYVEILAALKPTFINHPRCKELIREILREHACDLRKTFFDVPRLRTATSDEFLTSGLGYVFKPHRDTWYSPPQCQLNWWLPVYPFVAENAMAMFPDYWDRPVRNSSNEFNYQDWTQTGRKAAPKLVKTDQRRQSEALETVETNPDLRIVTEPGGLLIFSAAHLHATVPNTSGETRFSIDFRTVHMDDLAAQRGAANIDSDCSGTTIDDYLCGEEFTQLPDAIRSQYVALTKPILA
jgi:hypothetical protein